MLNHIIRPVFLGVVACFLLSGTAQAAPATRPAPRPVVKKTSTPTTRPVVRSATAKKTTAQTATPAASSKKPVMSKVPVKKDAMDKVVWRTAQLLATFLYEHGRDPNNPWLLSHSLLALGRHLKLKNGKSVVDHIVSTSLKKKVVNGVKLWYFPKGTHKHRIEPHPHMHLKPLLEIDVPMNRSFKVGKETVTLRQIFNSALHQFPAAPKGREIGQLAWIMSAAYGNLAKGQWKWINAKNKEVNFFRQIWKSMKYLDKNTTFLRLFKNRGVKVIPKMKLRNQYVYGEPCGGFHFQQAMFRWMGFPMFKARLATLMAAQIELMFYRFDAEMRLYMKLFRRYRRNAGYRFLILLQQLKFSGHFLETVGSLRQWGLFTPDKLYKKRIRSAVKILCVTVLLIDRMKFYHKSQLTRLKTMNAQTYQFYLDLLGDSAHALHSLLLIRRNSSLYKP